MVRVFPAERQHVHDRDHHGADDQADRRRRRGIDQPGQQRADALDGMVDEIFSVMD
jgi:hypothetical protein